jgi:hypothetical protein
VPLGVLKLFSKVVWFAKPTKCRLWRPMLRGNLSADN